MFYVTSRVTDFRDSLACFSFSLRRLWDVFITFKRPRSKVFIPFFSISLLGKSK